MINLMTGVINMVHGKEVIVTPVAVDMAGLIAEPPICVIITMVCGIIMLMVQVIVSA